VIRTNVPLERRASADVVRDYKRLADVEKSFRTIKTTMLQIRPIYHRAADRVRAHFLICMLSYYVVWHLRIAWRDFLFCDENIEKTRANRNPVETAKPNSHLKAKKANCKKIKSSVTSNSTNNEVTPSSNCETRIESFSSIMSELSKIVRNQCCVSQSQKTFHITTTPNHYQENLLNKIQTITAHPKNNPPVGSTN
jgi:hypothetical protein